MTKEYRVTIYYNDTITVLSAYYVTWRNNALQGEHRVT